MYNDIMNDFRLTFNTTTNFKIPLGILDVLTTDAYHFGYITNGHANISGFLNDLIPTLSDYQDDLHKRILKYHNGDEEKARISEQTIYNVYLRPFDFHDDSYVTVPLRINNKRKNHFLKIHDVKLRYYNLDFTNYIRNLLTEYATKTNDQRECLFQFHLLEKVKAAIKEQRVCRFYQKNFVYTFAPVVVETTPCERICLIAGISSEDHTPTIIELYKVAVNKLLKYENNPIIFLVTKFM